MDSRIGSKFKASVGFVKLFSKGYFKSSILGRFYGLHEVQITDITVKINDYQKRIYPKNNWLLFIYQKDKECQEF